jgi:hypothetical protein
MQRAILDTLDAARVDAAAFPSDAGWIWYGTCLEVRLAPEIYDLRLSSRYLKKQWQIDYQTEPRFQAAFSRAVRSLIRRQILEPVGLVHLADVFTHHNVVPSCVHYLADGTSLAHYKQQTRFVKRLV